MEWGWDICLPPARVVPAPPSACGVRTVLSGRDALRRVRSHPPFSPQNTQKPLRGTRKTLNFGSLSYISNTFRVFSDGLRPFRAFSGKTPSAPASPYLASGRLTRSAWRHGDTESVFEVGLRMASSTIRPLQEGRVPARPNAPTGMARHAKYPRRPRRVASEQIRPAVPCAAGRDALRRVRSHGLPSSHLCDPCRAKPVSVISVVKLLLPRLRPVNAEQEEARR